MSRTQIVIIVWTRLTWHRPDLSAQSLHNTLLIGYLVKSGSLRIEIKFGIAMMKRLLIVHLLCLDHVFEVEKYRNIIVDILNKRFLITKNQNTNFRKSKRSGKL